MPTRQGIFNIVNIFNIIYFILKKTIKIYTSINLICFLFLKIFLFNLLKQKYSIMLKDFLIDEKNKHIHI